jgi:uncharacterized protein
MSDKIADLAAKRAERQKAKPRKCPICGKPAVEASRPFCSPRCRNIDLDRWRSEAYRVPVTEDPDEEDSVRKEPEEET